MTSVLDDDSTSGGLRALIDQPGANRLVVSDWAACSAKGSRSVRNEDGWAQRGPVFVIADGMGGLSGGYEASALASQAVARHWLRFDERGAEAVVRTVNAEVRAELALLGVRGGCTLSALRVAHDQVVVAHVGDSRAYRLRGTNAELLTRDHNVRGELLAAGIPPAAAQSSGPLRALTSYLGLPDAELQVDVRSVGLRARDRLLLCTDGVFGEMSHAELVHRATVGDAETAARALTCNVGRDDATVVIVDIGTFEDEETEES